MRRRSHGKSPGQRRHCAVAGAAIMACVATLALVPIRPAVARTAVACTHDTFETVDPGLTSEVAVQHHNGSGTWVCTGSIVGAGVVAVSGPMDFLIRTEGNCLSERGVGTARAKIPLDRHDFALLRFTFLYTRAGNAIDITVTEGTAEVGGEKDDLVWHGVLQATPTEGDCVREPVAAARVTGQLMGSAAA